MLTELAERSETEAPQHIWSYLRPKKLLFYVGTQGAIQAANAMCGFLLVRYIAPDDFAWLTLCLSAMATINILADSGLGSAYSAIVGPMVQQKDKVVSIAQYMTGYRVKFAVLGSIAVAPVTGWLLYQKGQSLVSTLMCLSLVVLGSIISTQSVVFASTLKLRTRINELSRIEAVSAWLRLLLVCTVLALGATAPTAVLTTVAAQLAMVYLLKSALPDLVSLSNTQIEESEKQRTKQIVKSSLPLVIYSCVQGQVAIWILGLLGQNKSIADLGAVSRYALLFSLVGIPLSHFLFPAIARQPDDRIRLVVTRSCFGIIVAAIAIFSCFIVFERPMLWLLGDNYRNCATELRAFGFVGAIGFLTNSMWSIALSRGWVRHGWLQIPLGLLLMTITAAMVDLGTTVGAIAVSAAPTLASLIVVAGLISRHLLSLSTAIAPFKPA